MLKRRTADAAAQQERKQEQLATLVSKVRAHTWWGLVPERLGCEAGRAPCTALTATRTQEREG